MNEDILYIEKHGARNAREYVAFSLTTRDAVFRAKHAKDLGEQLAKNNVDREQIQVLPYRFVMEEQGQTVRGLGRRWGEFGNFWKGYDGFAQQDTEMVQ